MELMFSYLSRLRAALFFWKRGSIERLHSFKYWRVNKGNTPASTTTNNTTVTITKTTTVTAISACTLTINVNLDGSPYNKTVEVNGAMYTPVNGVVTVSMETGSYYTVKVSPTGDGTSYTETVASGTLTSGATVTVNYYTLTVNSDGGFTSDSGDGVYLSGQTASIGATTKSGYSFKRWRVDTGNTPASTATNNTTVTITKTTTVTAISTCTLTINVNLDGDPYNKTVEVNGGTYTPVNGIVTVTLETGSSYTVKVSPTGSGTSYTESVASGTLTSGTSVTVNYYTLTVNSDGGFTSDTGDGVYLSGKTVTIGATVCSDGKFSDWTVDTGSTPASLTDASTTITVTSTTTVTAHSMFDVTYVVVKQKDEQETIGTETYGSISSTGKATATNVQSVTVQNVPYGSTIKASGNTSTVTWSRKNSGDKATITATPSATTEQYTYKFVKFSHDDITITSSVIVSVDGAESVDAVFTRALTTHPLIVVPGDDPTPDTNDDPTDPDVPPTTPTDPSKPQPDDVPETPSGEDITDIDIDDDDDPNTPPTDNDPDDPPEYEYGDTPDVFVTTRPNSTTGMVGVKTLLGTSDYTGMKNYITAVTLRTSATATSDSYTLTWNATDKMYEHNSVNVGTYYVFVDGVYSGVSVTVKSRFT